ncbi:MAG: PAS domain-containing protein [Bacteroidia bacterium]
MKSQIINSEDPCIKHLDAFTQQIKNKSDVLMNYFLASYFLVGLGLAFFYDTWTVAIGVGGLSLLAYYGSRYFFSGSDLYQYVLSVLLGIFMAQYIYQMHGLFEMHFTAFISSAMLVTYQKWKLQLPLFLVVIAHHALFDYLQFSGIGNTYFTQMAYMDLQTFIIHTLLSMVVFFLCGLWAFHFNKYSAKHIQLNFELGRLQEEENQKERLLQMRDTLKASNHRLNEAEKIARMGSWEKNFANDILIWSDEMFRIFDIEKTTFNVSYDAYISFIHPDDRQNVKDIYKKYLGDHQPFEYECRIVTLKGVTKTIYVQGKVIVNDKNEVIKTHGIVQDITDRKLIEETLQRVLNGEIIKYEINHTQPDGSERLYNAKYFPVTENDKNFYEKPLRKEVVEEVINKQFLKSNNRA